MPTDRHDLLVRAGGAVLVVAAAVAVLLSAPVALRTTLVALAAAAVAARLAARRGRGAADAVLVAVGGVLVLLVLTGLGLDLVGVPLARRGWAVALGVLGLLAALAPLPARATTGTARPRPAAVLRQAPWALACAAVVAVALTSSVRSAGSVDVAPVALSVGPARDGHVAVVVSTEQATGLLELRADNGSGTALSYPLFQLGAGGSRTTDVLLPADGRTTITVNNPGQAQPLRTVVVYP